MAITANFTVDNTSLDYAGPVNFTDTSTSTLPIVSWDWDFGDGSPHSYVQNPSHVYTKAGLFSVTLTVFDGSVYDTRTIPDFITVNMVANFIAQNNAGIADLTVSFFDISLGEPTAWDWDFGDGSPVSHDQNPSHTYTDTGTYTITLTVDGTTGSDSTILVITAIMVGRFRGSPRLGYNPLVVYFRDKSTGSPSPVAWLWNFGDGQISTEQNPVHQYTSADTYTVTLTITNANSSLVITKQAYITVRTLKADLITAIKTAADTYGDTDTARTLGTNGTDWERVDGKYQEAEVVIQGIAEAMTDRTIRFDGPFNSLIKLITDFVTPKQINLNNIFGVMIGDVIGVDESTFNNSGFNITGVPINEFEYGVTGDQPVNTETPTPIETTIGPYKNDYNIEKTIWKIQAGVKDRMPLDATENKSGLVRTGLSVALIPSPTDDFERQINDLIIDLKNSGLLS